MARPPMVMPSNTRSAKSREDDPVLEGAGLALVGVADDVLLVGLLGRAEVPLHAGGEAGAAAALEAGVGDEVDDVAARQGQRGLEAGFRLDGGVGEGIALVSAVSSCVGPPGAGRRAAVGDDLAHRLRRDARVDLVVDEQGGALVAHADAARPLEREQPSSVVWSKPMPSSSASAAATASLPAKSHDRVPHRRMTKLAFRARRAGRRRTRRRCRPPRGGCPGPSATTCMASLSRPWCCLLTS